MNRTILALLALGCASRTPTPEPAAAAVAPAPPEPPAPKVEPIPEGFRTLTPMLVVSDVPGAIDFYTRAFGAESRYVMDGPDGAPVHAEIQIGDSILMLSPENPEHDEKAPSTVKGSNGSLHVYVPDTDAAFKTAVDAGARPLMPVADMWWGDRFGEVMDPYGHVWSLGTHQEDVPAEAMKARAQAATAAMASGKKYTWEKGPAAAGFQPEGYATVTPSLVIKGGASAVDFYASALGAQIVTSDATPDGSLLHAELKVGDAMLMLSGEMPPTTEGPMAEMAAYAKAPATLGAAPLSLMVYVPDTDAAVATANAAGAATAMPPADMFWGDRFGVVVDPSGTPWAIATRVEDVSAEEMKARMLAQQAPSSTAPSANP